VISALPRRRGCETLYGQVVSKKDTFCYMESMFQEDEDIDEDVSYGIKVGCLKLCQASGVFCDLGCHNS
jgi:hypothetical protein